MRFNNDIAWTRTYAVTWTASLSEIALSVNSRIIIMQGKSLVIIFPPWYNRLPLASCVISGYRANLCVGVVPGRAINLRHLIWCSAVNWPASNMWLLDFSFLTCAVVNRNEFINNHDLQWYISGYCPNLCGELILGSVINVGHLVWCRDVGSVVSSTWFWDFGILISRPMSVLKAWQQRNFEVVLTVEESWTVKHLSCEASN